MLKNKIYKYNRLSVIRFILLVYIEKNYTKKNFKFFLNFLNKNYQ